MAEQLKEALARKREADATRQYELTILRMPRLKAKIGLCRAAIYDRLDPDSPRYDPSFPRPISLGARAVGWIESEVDAWIVRQIQARLGRDVEVVFRKAQPANA